MINTISFNTSMCNIDYKPYYFTYKYLNGIYCVNNWYIYDIINNVYFLLFIIFLLDAIIIYLMYKIYKNKEE